MHNFNLALKQLLRKDIADKTLAPAVTFLILTVLLLYVSLDYTAYPFIIRGSAIFMILILLDRFQLIRRYRKTHELTEGTWRHFKISIILSLICWSVIFSFVALEVQFSGVSFIVLSFVLCCFVTASLTTISADMSIFAPAQVLLLAPQAGMIAYDSLTYNKYGLAPLIPMYVILFIYQMIQVKDVRKQSIERFRYQYELKKRNLELQEIQEAQTQQTIKLIHTSRLAAVGEMAAGIAHEVNNPLAIISGSLQQLERKLQKLRPADSQFMIGHTDRSHHAIERITKIINGLRLFSQQSDALPKETVRLESIILETLNFCSELLKARYVRLEIAPVPEAHIDCHPVQISQVLINLIKNAQDALKVETDESKRWVRISFEKDAETIKLIVQNGGAKIPQDLQPRLFTPFFTTKTVGEGTGLGLSISKGIMVEHGGDLQFDDSEDCTTFIAILPLMSSWRSAAPSNEHSLH